jgi:hypothetical protein
MEVAGVRANITQPDHQLMKIYLSVGQFYVNGLLNCYESLSHGAILSDARAVTHCLVYKIHSN